MQPVGSYGVWSATPTPFNNDMHPDHASLERTVEHHIQLGVRGVFVGGTCGEGTWMNRKDLYSVVETISKASAGRLLIAAQVSDASSERIVENMECAAKAGADFCVIATPLSNGAVSESKMRQIYMDSIERCPTPVGIYDRGKYGPFVVSEEILAEAYRHPNVALVKDSSDDDAHIVLAVKAREDRPELKLLTGYEFDTVKYLQAGYDGLLLGGGVFNGIIAAKIIAAVQNGDIEEAWKQQNRMNDLMYAVYGEGIKFWLAGLKKLLVEMGLFSTTNLHLEYEVTPECAANVKQAMIDYKDILWP